MDYQKMFFFGAVWNWVAAGSTALGYKILFPLFNMQLPAYPVFLLLFLGLCFVYGIGYFWVSQDLSQNRGIVKMGIIGKLMVFVGFLWGVITGQVHFIFIGVGIVDLVFTVLFIKFLQVSK